MTEHTDGNVDLLKTQLIEGYINYKCLIILDVFNYNDYSKWLGLIHSKLNGE